MPPRGQKGQLGFDPSSLRRQRRAWLGLVGLAVAFVLVMSSFSPLGGSVAGAVLFLVLVFVFLRGVFWAGGGVADSMTQFNVKPAPTTLSDSDVADSLGPAAGASGVAGATYFSTHAAPTDWVGYVRGLSARLEEALGPAYTVRGDSFVVVIEHGGDRQRVALTGALEPPPLDETERALRAARRLLDEAQRFAERIDGAPWPKRDPVFAVEATSGHYRQPGTTEAAAWLESGEIRLGWADDLGTVLMLSPIPWFDPAELNRPPPQIF